MNNNFHDLLKNAIAGDHTAIEKILEIYAPLMKSRSKTIDGVIDEDCLQFIKLRVIEAIPKFKI